MAFQDEPKDDDIEVLQVRAYIFTEKLHDITDDLKALQIAP